jgi:hypothetical protein
MILDPFPRFRQVAKNERYRDRQKENSMDLYSRFILPQVIELAMGQKTFAPFRERVVGAARGRVLEIGIGSGLNLASYRPSAERFMESTRRSSFCRKPAIVSIPHEFQ